MNVISLGILVVDVIGRPIDALPARGALQLVPSISPHIGGCAANTGIALQKLGVRTRVVGAVGRDGFGDFVAQTLAQHKVEATLLRKTEPTSATMVLVAGDGERSFLHCVGANAAFTFADVDESWLDGANWLHIAGHGLMPGFDGQGCAQLLQLAQARGVRTSLDTAGAPDEKWRTDLRACLPHLDVLVPSLSEVEALFPGATTPENIAARLLGEGVRTVALKMGERGSFAASERESVFAPPLEVEVVDATGAGDAFAAGFIAGVLRDLPLLKCAQLGNACGALCVGGVGTVAGLGSWPQTARLAGLQTGAG